VALVPSKGTGQANANTRLFMLTNISMLIDVGAGSSIPGITDHWLIADTTGPLDVFAPAVIFLIEFRQGTLSNPLPATSHIVFSTHTGSSS